MDKIHNKKQQYKIDISPDHLFLNDAKNAIIMLNRNIQTKLKSGGDSKIEEFKKIFDNNIKQLEEIYQEGSKLDMNDVVRECEDDNNVAKKRFDNLVQQISDLKQNIKDLITFLKIINTDLSSQNSDQQNIETKIDNKLKELMNKNSLLR